VKPQAIMNKITAPGLRAHRSLFRLERRFVGDFGPCRARFNSIRFAPGCFKLFFHLPFSSSFKAFST
jgi:hypothetical protein